MLTADQINNVKIAEQQLLKAMYPNVSAYRRKALHELLAKNNVVLIDLDQLYSKTDDLLCSIIRHKDTDYDHLVMQVEKYKARAILGPIIGDKLSFAKLGAIGQIDTRIAATGSPVKVIKDRVPDPSAFMPQVVGHDPAYSDASNYEPYFNIKPHIGSSPDLTGTKFGQMTVIGASRAVKGRWVCQCKCGQKEIRKARSITNPIAPNGKCSVCSYADYIAVN